ncbi:beta-galactosidase beta subunit [Bacillus pakistanensis]|uniref:Beta-galactosidase beta subunit n=1 Tax=Rossellomorea pakistanensis TaxID=992288 RepID=A0ABS2NC49_9BACI|nr:hypothetical protein [Bacillus pakistanensis]MBM7585442.1 beta-galactosidase beta subunit [Bacillus pakistanensis]
MEILKEVLECRLQHEGLRSVIPSVEDCRRRLVYEQQDRLLEWLVFEKENRNYGCLIEHQADQMKILSDSTTIEQCKSYEGEAQALYEIGDVFFNPERNRHLWPTYMKKNKRFEAFQTYLEVFAILKDSEDILTSIQVDQEEAEFVVALFERLRDFYEIGNDSSSLLLWRETKHLCINKWLKDLHSAFIIFRKLTKLPFQKAHKLGVSKVRLMTGVGWRWLHWQVYTYWHDEYFYLFSRLKSNPEDFEKMEQTLMNKTSHAVYPLFPMGAKVSEMTLSCDRESFRFPKEGDL